MRIFAVEENRRHSRQHHGTPEQGTVKAQWFDDEHDCCGEFADGGQIMEAFRIAHRA